MSARFSCQKPPSDEGGGQVTMRSATQGGIWCIQTASAVAEQHTQSKDNFMSLYHAIIKQSLENLFHIGYNYKL